MVAETQGGPAAPADVASRERRAPGTGMTRRTLAAIGVTAALSAAGLTDAGAARALAAGEDQAYQAYQGTPGPQEALQLLMEGNQRWSSGTATHPHQSVAWRRQVAGHQDPFATVISCIDSRVPPEVVFDRGIGDMFTIRTGAQTLDESVVLGSIEFGAHIYSSARLMLVLGHQACGAIAAAIEVIEGGGSAPGHIQAVVEALRPAYHLAKPLPGDLADNMSRVQTKLTVHALKQDPLLARLMTTDGLTVVGGHYDLDSGLVQIIA
jgi:carbonic anhydrase